MNNDNEVFVSVPLKNNDLKKMMMSSRNCPLNLKELADQSPKLSAAKFDLGDDVYFLDDAKIRKGTIASVELFRHCFASQILTSVNYWVCNSGYYNESRLFSSKEELLASL